MSKGSTPPVIAVRSVSQRKASAWWSLEKFRISFEYFALRGLLDVVLDADETLLANLVAQLKQHL